jgi:uncharacterized protein YqeY
VSLRVRLQSELTDAMRARDARRTSVLRSTLSAIANAEAVEVPAVVTATEVPRRDLSEDDIRAIVAREHDDLVETATMLRADAKVDEARELEAHAAVLAGALAI